MSKIVVDLDHPVWLSEPGYGNEGMLRAPYCALGKLKVAANLETTNIGVMYENIYSLIPHPIDYWSVNDAGCISGGSNIYNGKPENHWKAVRMVLEDLASNPNVELKGTMISDVIKEKVNV